jgi:uncharacterized membrane protein YkvA (DUF1232 family)
VRMAFIKRWFTWAQAAGLKRQLLALWHLLRHPATPRPLRWLAIAVVAYAVSPIDLIPDFIPVLGFLDELILLPLAVALIVRLTPAPLWQQCLAEAERTAARLPRWRAGALIVIGVWLLLLVALGWGIIAWLA